jgi:ABC-type transporter Mla MlaB component
VTITISPDLSSPARLTASDSLEAVDAVDVIDLLDLFWPEAVELDLSQTTRVSAAAVKVLASGIRRARDGGQSIDIVHAKPLVQLFLTITGLHDVKGIEVADVQLVEEPAA